MPRLVGGAGRWLAVLAAAVLGGTACSHRASNDPAASTVVVSATGCRPTPTAAMGVVIADGLVLTVAHAVAGEHDVAVRRPGGDVHVAEVAAIDGELDVAVLRVDGLAVTPAPWRAHEAGDPVRVLVEDGDRVAERSAQVRGRRSIRTADIYRHGEHVRPALELVAAVSAGDSGAPVVGEDGAVVGLVWARSRRTDDRAWALPVEAAVGVLDAAGRGGGAAVPCAR